VFNRNIRGKDIQQQSFAGVAFRGVSGGDFANLRVTPA
jgi:hypothetical protein